MTKKRIFVKLAAYMLLLQTACVIYLFIVYLTTLLVP